MSTFDPNHDYFEDLKSSEKYTDKDGKEYPYLRGLWRLAHTNRGGVKSVHTRIVKAPSLNREDSEGQPDCLAAAVVRYEFNDGTVFEGAADASFKAHEAPFNLHLTAIAESKADARALRKAFLISKVTKEEIGSASLVVGDPDGGPISDAQMNGIRIIAKKKKLGKADVLKLIKRTDITELDDLTAEEGRKAMKALNRAKPKAAKPKE